MQAIIKGNSIFLLGTIAAIIANIIRKKGVDENYSGDGDDDC